jgi:peptide deformylase
MNMRVVQLGNPILRRKAEKVPVSEIGSQKFQDIIEQLLEVMRGIKSVSAAHGNGLAAPQIDHPYQIIARFYDGNYRVFINPEITKKSNEVFDYSEGCLSYFYLRAKVERHRHITVSCYDQHGAKLELNFSDDLAGFAQHEIDHINGIPYIDRVKNLTRLVSIHEQYKNDAAKLNSVLRVIDYVTAIHP